MSVGKPCPAHAYFYGNQSKTSMAQITPFSRTILVVVLQLSHSQPYLLEWRRFCGISVFMIHIAGTV